MIPKLTWTQADPTWTWSQDYPERGDLVTVDILDANVGRIVVTGLYLGFRSRAPVGWSHLILRSTGFEHVFRDECPRFHVIARFKETVDAEEG